MCKAHGSWRREFHRWGGARRLGALGCATPALQALCCQRCSRCPDWTPTCGGGGGGVRYTSQRVHSEGVGVLYVCAAFATLLGRGLLPHLAQVQACLCACGHGHGASEAEAEGGRELRVLRIVMGQDGRQRPALHTATLNVNVPPQARWRPFCSPDIYIPRLVPRAACCREVAQGSAQHFGLVASKPS